MMSMMLKVLVMPTTQSTVRLAEVVGVEGDLMPKWTNQGG